MSDRVLIQLKRHVTRLRSCTDCPQMIGPVVSGGAVVSPVMLIGQAPGNREGPAGKPFAWTAGKTLFGWFAGIGIDETDFRSRVYMAAVCRCFPGKADGGGDRVPSDDEVQKCSRHLHAEARLLQPRLVIPVGKLAIAQLFPEAKQLVDVVGAERRAKLGDVEVDAIALPHPSGASTWHRTEPGKTLLVRALAKIAQHEAWQSILPTEAEKQARSEAEAAAAIEAGQRPVDGDRKTARKPGKRSTALDARA